MSLNSIIADVFDLDLDDLKGELSLQKDLHMTAEQAEELAETIAEFFDDLQVDFARINTLDDLFNCVVAAEFEDIPAASAG